MRPCAQPLHQLRRVELMALLHPTILETRTLHWSDEAAGAAFAAALAARPAIRDALIELRGELGAGKTTFARQLLRALGVQGRVKSPSYALLETYELPELTVAHLDFYRFEDPAEWVDAGLRDVFAAPGLKLVEWPERAAGLLPPPDLCLQLQIRGETVRRVDVSAHSARGRELLA